MLAILIGDIALLVGLSVMVMPLVLTELSRPRDGVWGAVFLLFGLVLTTSSERLRGSPMLAVFFGALLIGRFGLEVAQSRWNQLSDNEKTRLGSLERWTSSGFELRTIFLKLIGILGSFGKGLMPQNQPIARQKKWVRPEQDKDSQSFMEEENASIDSLGPNKSDVLENTKAFPE